MSNTNNNAEWTPPAIAVQPIHPAALPEAQALAKRLSVALLDSEHSSSPSQEQWVLQLGGELPQLVRPDGVHWSIDYRIGKARRRAAEPDRANQPLARALGISKLNEIERRAWHVVDGTAGAGADGWQLAAAGASVTLVEQHPVLFAMLASAMHAALNHEPTQSIATRVDVINNTIGCALDTLNHSEHGPVNAVYLDPMYPTRRSKAAVKKPMQFIQALVGGGPDPATVLEQCLLAFKHSALNRVVVKRPSEAAPLIEPQHWSGQLVSVDAGAARFDIYLNPTL